MTTTRAAGVLALLVLALLPASGEAELRFTREEYPVVDGSTSTQPLGVLVAAGQAELVLVAPR